MVDTTEKNFESTIEAALLAGGPDAYPGTDAAIREVSTAYGTLVSGGYLQRTSADYDEDLCLDPEMAVKFVQVTQPKEWSKLVKQYRDQARDRFVKRLAGEIAKRGTLDVLRKGIRDVGARIRLVFFQPPSGLNPDLQQRYQANLFSVVRQLEYSVKDGDARHRKSLDVALFLNGIPLFTVELKNPLTGQTYKDAIRQYRTTRSDPQEPLLAFGRCLAHLAVDPDQVWFATHLEGQETRFFPLNKGRGTGAGNPVPSPGTFATAYLWEELWAKDSILNLIERFVHEVDVLDDKGRPTGERQMIYPRYHQLDAVRRLLFHAREHGPGERYLIQHSAGSGKSYTISWLAHQLASLHDADDNPVFDSIIVITDRRVLDRQLRRHVRQFEQTRGLVQAIDKTSQQLKDALEAGKRIVVTTLQKFPVISNEIDSLPGHNFAVLVDEAHSSQSGEQSKHLKAVLSVDSLDEAADQDGVEGEDWEDLVVREMQTRGHLSNVSTFAFTATPKRRTLELFGTRQPDGSYRPFSLYSMRQAIEEGFIMDVLEHYTTYKSYWSLLKKAAEDPDYDRRKASALLTRYVDLHEHAIEQKVATISEHFHARVAHRIAGQAKAMIVTRSRLHAVRFKLALDRYLQERGYPYKALVAFSGTVDDGGIKYTESGMNRFPERQTAEQFNRPEHRFLVVANKFQTGFDQPLLAAMYVDKRLGGVHAVQTLSRLNRIHPDKQATFVLDFANEAEVIQAAFAPYYETTLLTEATDPNLLYDLQHKLEDYHLYTQEEVDRLAETWFTAQKAGQVDTAHPKIHNALQPAVDRFDEMEEDEQEAFRGYVQEYVRLYAFLSQVITFLDAGLEKLYLFCRLLQRRLPGSRDPLPVEVLGKVELETYNLRLTHNGEIGLKGEGELKPQGAEGEHRKPEEDRMALSEIVALLNEHFGLEVSRQEGEDFLTQLQQHLVEDQALAASVQVNTPEDARLTFNHAINDRMQDMLDVSFKFYKLYTEDPGFAAFLRDLMFTRYLRGTQRETGV